MEAIKVGKISIPIIEGKQGAPGTEGAPGKDGDNGYSPVKGQDYFTDDEIDEITSNAAQQSADIVVNDINNKIEKKLTEYYKKNETYNRTEIDNKISVIPKYEHIVVDQLPTTNISTEAVYLVPSSSDANDMYREYIYINGKWELIGIQKADLSNFYNKSEIDQELSKRDTKISDLEKQVGDISSVLDEINGEVV